MSSASVAGNINLNTERFPILVVEFSGKASDEQFRQYLQGMDQHLERCLTTGKRSVVVYDTLKATSPVSAAQRKLQADWMSRNFMRSKMNMNGIVFVMDNMLVRGVLTAILWLQSMPCNHAVFATRQEADAWATEKVGGTVAPMQSRRIS